MQIELEEMGYMNTRTIAATRMFRCFDRNPKVSLMLKPEIREDGRRFQKGWGGEGLQHYLVAQSQHQYQQRLMSSFEQSHILKALHQINRLLVAGGLSRGEIIIAGGFVSKYCVVWPNRGEFTA